MSLQDLLTLQKNYTKKAKQQELARNAVEVLKLQKNEEIKQIEEKINPLISTALQDFNVVSNSKEDVEKQIIEMSWVELDVLISKVLERLNKNKKNKWHCIRTDDFGIYRTLQDGRSLERTEIIYLKPERLDTKFKEARTCYVGDADYDAHDLFQLAYDNKAIIMHVGHVYPKNMINLYKSNYGKEYNLPGDGLSLNNTFYMSKYPFLKKVLKSLIK